MEEPKTLTASDLLDEFEELVAEQAVKPKFFKLVLL